MHPVRHWASRYGRIFAWCQRLAAVLLISAFTLASPAAHAAGFWTLDRGVSTYGRGGANFVRPRDPIALYTNPAALAGLRGLQLMLDGNAVYDAKSFTRAPDDLDGDGRPTQYQEVTNAYPVFPPSPGIFAAYNLASVGVPLLAPLTVGFGVFGPTRTDTEFPADGPQRFSVIETHNLQVHYGLALAYELPFWHLRLGVTGQLVNQIIQQRLALNLVEFATTYDAQGNPTFRLGPPEDPGYDVDATVRAEDNDILTATFGLSLQPLPFLAVALSAQAPWNVDAAGTVDLALGEDVQDLAEVQGDRLRVRLKMPWILRAAVQVFEPEDTFDVELAFVYETWSRNAETELAFDDVRFVPSPLLGADPVSVSTITFPSHWRDAYSVRLGGSYLVLPSLLRLRAGAYFERDAVPEQYVSAGAFGLDKLGVTLGARVDLPFDQWLALPFGLWLDLAAGYVHWFGKDITGSEQRFINPATIDGGAAQALHPVANGRYRAYQVIMMASLGVRVGI